MREGKFLVIVLMILLFANLTFISASDVPQNYQQLGRENITITGGMELKIPQDNVLKAGQNYTFYVHAYDIATGLSASGKTDCKIWIYNSTGEVIYNKTNTYIIGDAGQNFHFFINGGNFTTIGDYYYNVECFDDAVGGFASSVIHVTLTGDDLGISQAIVIIALLGFAFLLFGLGRAFVNNWKMRLFFDILSLLIGVLCLNSVRILASQSDNIHSMANGALIIGLIVVSFMFVYAFVYYTVELFRYLRNKREMKWKS